MKLSGARGVALAKLAVAAGLIALVAMVAPVASSATTSRVPGVARSVHASLIRSTAVVRWRPPTSDGDSPVTRYRAISHPSGLSCTTEGTSCDIAQLKNKTTYRFTVEALNRHGSGPNSSLSNSVTVSTTITVVVPPAPPSPPTTTTTVPSGGGGGGGSPPPTSYSVAFNANGGTGSMSSETESSPTALTSNDFTNAGYSFSGWNTVANGTGTTYANDATYSFSSSTTLYAQWTALPDFTVVFNANGGTGTMANETENVSTALTSNAFSRVGYNFTGWNTSANGSGTAYGNGATYPFNTSTTLYAQWAALFTVTFNANGGTGSMANESESAPTALTSNAFTRTGYNFSGWNTSSSGSGSAYANGAVYSFSSSTTLYAQWISSNAPVITLQPTNGAAAENSSVNFTASATGTPTPTVQWQESGNGGSTWTSLGAGATSTTLSITATASDDGFEFEAVFSNTSGSTTTSPAQITVLVGSGNWSGYVVQGGIYSAVSGQWTVPTLVCNGSTTEHSSEWVGIDGDPSLSVEQDGTEADCDGTTPVYSAWYEMLGDPNVNSGYSVPLSPANSYPVSAGDVVAASVSYASNEWTLALHDVTANWTFSVTVAEPPTPPDQSSAEWIVESPEICNPGCAEGPLSDFGTVTFTNASVTSSGTTTSILTGNSLAIVMLDSSDVFMAAPGVLSGDGSIFTDVWSSST